MSGHPRDVIFLGYHAKDRDWLDRIVVHLEPLLRGTKLTLWNDTKIPAGADRGDEFEGALSRACAVVLLISADYLAAPELEHVLRSSRISGASILWLPVRPSAYQATELAYIKPLTEPSRTLSLLDNEDAESELVRICTQVVNATTLASSDSLVAHPVGRVDAPDGPAIKRVLFTGSGRISLNSLDVPSPENPNKFLRPYIRRLLDMLLVSDEQIDTYCIDFFPETYHLFSNNTQRLQKINLLLTNCDPGDIVESLKTSQPGDFDKIYNMVIKSMQPTGQSGISKKQMIDDIVKGQKPTLGQIDTFAMMKDQSVHLMATLQAAPQDDLFAPITMPTGPVIYRISDGIFHAIYLKVIQNGGLDLSFLKPIDYRLNVQNDGFGNVTLLSADGRIILGSGAVRNNQGMLTAGEISIKTESETWQSRRSVKMKVTGDNLFEIEVFDYRTERRKLGLFGKNLPACLINFQATLTL